MAGSIVAPPVGIFSRYVANAVKEQRSSFVESASVKTGKSGKSGKESLK
jgi:hypothetical protein